MSDVPSHPAHRGHCDAPAALVRGDRTWRDAAPTGVTDSEPVCRWSFGEDAGEVRWSGGRERYGLQEMAGPVRRGSDGPGGGPTLELEEGQWLSCPRSRCPALNFRGKGARFSVLAWVRRRRKSTGECEAIAGLWNETGETRQYALFLNLHIWDSAQQACGHLSATGGPSPGYRYCMEAAIGTRPLAFETWHLVAFTFDGFWARIYLDGHLDYRPGLNPYYWPCPINDGGAAGSDFTVGGVLRHGAMGNWFRGALGGLAIYDQCLDETSIERRWQKKTV